MNKVVAFLGRVQFAHALTGSAVIFAALAGTVGVHTTTGAICLGFALLHLVLSYVESSRSSRLPIWLRNSAVDVDRLLDGATGLVPVLSAVRILLIARAAPAWAVTAVDDLIAVAPYAGTATFPLSSGTTVPTASGAAQASDIRIGESKQTLSDAKQAPGQAIIVGSSPPPTAAHS